MNKVYLKRSNERSVWSKALLSALIVALGTTLTCLSSEASEQTSESGGIAADLGFRPDTNGFSFENYGAYIDSKKTQSPTNLTSVEIRRMFGDQVCASNIDDNGMCELTPPVQEWMEKINSAMGGGHCEGFAVLSSLFYAGKVSPQSFRGNTTPELQVVDNKLLQREIAYWFATQYLQGVNTTQHESFQRTPKEIVDILKTAYQGGKRDETYRISIFKPGYQGGHAITPYQVIDKGNGIYWIMVYDSNWTYKVDPLRDKRYIEINTIDNTWKYEAGAPTDSRVQVGNLIYSGFQPNLYQGDANSKTLGIVANNWRLGQQDCEPCKKSSTSTTSSHGINTVGNVSLLITDEQGRQLGYKGGQFINQIPEAQFTPIVGQNLAGQDVPPVYDLPVGLGATLTLEGKSVAGNEENPDDEVVVIGPGYYIGVEDIDIAPGEKDTLKLAGDGKSITYKTSDSESPTIVVGAERSGADFSLELQAKDIQPDTETIVEFEPERGVMKLRSTSNKAGTFNIAMNRIDKQGEEKFERSEDIVLQPGDIIEFDFGKWDGQGDSLEIQTDHGGNGSVDETSNLADPQ